MGGDTTRGPLSLTVTVLGSTPADQYLTPPRNPAIASVSAARWAMRRQVLRCSAGSLLLMSRRQHFDDAIYQTVCASGIGESATKLRDVLY